MRTIVLFAALATVLPAPTGAVASPRPSYAATLVSDWSNDFPPIPDAGVAPGSRAPSPAPSNQAPAPPTIPQAGPQAAPGGLPSPTLTIAPYDNNAGRASINLGDDCAALQGLESWEVRNELLTFKVVFGKSALDWNGADYRQAIALAKSCHGARVGSGIVDGNNWAAMLEFAFRNVLPVAIVAHKVDEYAEDLHASKAKLPRCPRLLDFTHDDWASTDNSKDLFGVDFMNMDDDDLDKSVLYANECLLYLPNYALAARNIRENDSTKVLDEVMDRALLVLKRRRDFADPNVWGPHRDTDIVLTKDGADMLPTMASATAREMIQRFNRAAATKRKFTPETVSTLVRLSDTVLAANQSAYDKEYALAIQKRVQDMIFRRGD